MNMLVGLLFIALNSVEPVWEYAGYRVDTDTQTRPYLEAQLLEQRMATPPKHLVILSGSSMTRCGLDRDILETELTQAWGTTHIAKLYVNGAIQAERAILAKRFWKELSKDTKAKLADTKITVLVEVDEPYERTPLNSYSGHLSNRRGQSVFNAVTALKTLYAYNKMGTYRRPPKLTPATVRKIASATLINRTKISLLDDLIYTQDIAPNSIECGVQNSLNAEVVQDLNSHWKKKPPRLVSEFDWVVTARDNPIRHAFGNAASFGYYSVASAPVYLTAHMRSICANRENLDSCFIGSDPHLVVAIDEEQGFSDQRHMNDTGARIYTKALANYMIENSRR